MCSLSMVPPPPNSPKSHHVSFVRLQMPLWISRTPKGSTSSSVWNIPTGLLQIHVCLLEQQRGKCKVVSALIKKIVLYRMLEHLPHMQNGISNCSNYIGNLGLNWNIQMHVGLNATWLPFSKAVSLSTGEIFTPMHKSIGAWIDFSPLTNMLAGTRARKYQLP